MDTLGKRIKNMGMAILHWLLADVAAMVSFYVQFAFSKKVEPSGGLFGGWVYDINIPMYFLGFLLFAACYFLIWKYFLSKDWIGYDHCHWVWKAGFVFLAGMNQILLFYGWIVAIIFAWGFFGWLADIRQKWVFQGIFVYLAYVVAFPIAYLEIKKKGRPK